MIPMKRTLHIFSCLVFSLFFNTVSGQTDSTNDTVTDFLRNYRSPNYTYMFLRLDPSISQSSNLSDDLKRYQVNLQARVNFNVNTLKDKSNTNLSISTFDRFQRGVVNDIKTQSDNFLKHQLWSQGTKDFYLSGDAFVGVGFNYNGRAEKTLIDDWSSLSENDLSIPLGFGFGRPFAIHQAWKATTLFNDLECNGIAVERSLAKELADLFTVQNFTRFFDSRLGRIQNRTEVFSFLQENGITEFNPFSAAVIEDSFRYETFRTRLSGFRIFGGIAPGVKTNRTKSNAFDTSNRAFYLSPFLQFDYHLPINEDWQFDLNSKVEYENNISEEIINRNQTTGYFVANLAWVPNYRIRTALQLNYSTSLSENFNFHGVDLGYRVDYYISPAVSVNLNMTFRKQWQEVFTVKNENFSNNFSTGFSYFIL